MLDINKLREDKGGEPDLVRESQKIRGISPATVDDCIAADEEWIKGI
jgi:seryl-tRNA synthetase